jgi:hypothetical protein
MLVHAYYTKQSLTIKNLTMKQILLFAIVVLMLSTFFLTGCNKDLITTKKPTISDSVKTASLIHSAKISTIVSDYFSATTTDKSGNIYGLKNANTSTIYSISASGQESVFYAPQPVGSDTSHISLSCLTTDSLGNLYTVSLNSFTHLQRILKISPAGVASTFLNNFSQYISSRNSFVYEIIIDKDANLYFGDIDGIHKLTPAGTLTLIKQVYQSHFAVDKNGDVVFPLKDSNGKIEIVKVSPQGVQSVVITPAQVNFSQVGEVAADKWGNIFVSDLTNNTQNTIYVVNADNALFTVITSANGSTDGALATAKIYEPFNMSTDAAGNLYFFEVSDYGGGSDIRKIVF